MPFKAGGYLACGTVEAAHVELLGWIIFFGR